MLREAKDAEKALARKMMNALDGTSPDATRIHETLQKKRQDEAARKKNDGWWEWASMAAIALTVVAVLATAAMAVMQGMHASGGPGQASNPAGFASPAEDVLDTVADDWQEEL
jgi:hypothetical protein